MPLYDCLLLVKSHVGKEMIMDLVGRVGKRVHQRKGVITDLTSFGKVQLGYGIKKLDGRHYQGQLMQMTMMVPPTFNKELQYLNKEDRLLRWIVKKHRSNVVYGLEKISEDDGVKKHRSNVVFGLEKASDDDGYSNFRMFPNSKLDSKEEEEDDEDDDDDDDGDDENDVQ